MTISQLDHKRNGYVRYVHAPDRDFNGRSLRFFIPNTVPGNKVRVTVPNAKGRRQATLPFDELLEASPDRDLSIPIKGGNTGGTPLIHMKYDSQLAYKTQHIRDCLANQELDSGLVKPTLGMAEPSRYRNKMGLTFGPTEISYLENKFINMAIDVDRYKVRYGNDPNPGNVTEEKNRRQENRLIRKS